MKKPPGWKKRPRKSKYDNVDPVQLATDLRELGTLQDVAKKLGCGTAVVRKLVEKHALHKAWNEGHEARLDRLDEAKEPKREEKRAEVRASIEAAQAAVTKHTKTLFNAWSIPMSEQKKAERALIESIAAAKKGVSRLRTMRSRRDA